MAIQSPPLKLALLIGQMRQGGMESQVWELYSRLDRSKFTAQLITFAPDLSAIPTNCFQEAIVIPKHHAIDIPFYRQLKRYLQEFQPDIIFTFLYTANLWGLFAACAVHISTVIAYEGGLEMWLSGSKRRIASWVHHRVKYVVVNSRNSQKFYSSMYKLPIEHYPLIYNGVDSEYFKPNAELRQKGRLELGLGMDDEVIGLVATFKPAKDHITFLSAAKLASSKRPNLKFLLLGYGPLETLIREHITQLGLNEHVIIAHPSQVQPQHYAACDITGLASTEEGFSNALLEGMAMGIPQVATRVGGNPEAVTDGVDGILVPAGDALALAEAWLLLLADAELRKRMGLAARQEIEKRFGMERSIRETEKFLLTTVQALGEGFEGHLL